MLRPPFDPPRRNAADRASKSLTALKTSQGSDLVFGFRRQLRLGECNLSTVGRGLRLASFGSSHQVGRAVEMAQTKTVGKLGKGDARVASAQQCRHFSTTGHGPKSDVFLWLHPMELSDRSDNLVHRHRAHATRQPDPDLIRLVPSRCQSHHPIQEVPRTDHPLSQG